MCSRNFLFKVRETISEKYFNMWKKVTLPLQGIFLKLIYWYILSFIIKFSTVDSMPARAVLLNAEPVEAVDVRRLFYKPIQNFSKRKLPKTFSPPWQEDYYYEPSFTKTDSFSMGPEDAVSDHKYSPPAIVDNTDELHRNSRGDYSQIYRRTPSNHKEVYVPAPHISLSSKNGFQSSVWHAIKPPDTLNPLNNRNYPSVLISETIVTEATVTSDYKINGDSYSLDKEHKLDIALNTHFVQNNFTDTNDSHASVPSNTVLRFQPPPLEIPKDNHSKVQHFEYNESTLYQVPNATETETMLVPNNSTLMPIDDSDLYQKDAPELPPVYDKTETSVDPFDEESTKKSTVYFSVDNKVTFEPTVNEEKENISEVPPPVGSTKQYKFSSGAVAGIVIAVLTCITVITSSVIYLLYRKYNGQCTSVVEGKFNSDNCGYLDDSLRSSVYLNNHIELPKENSEEMTSLDNDSFLNSLETMTIQNYWADNTKNTKV